MNFTKEIIADIIKFAGVSVTLINRDANFAAYVTRTDSGETEDTWKATIKRNVDHLETVKAYKDDDDKSVWTSEDFTAIDKAIVDGKKVYGG